MSKSKPSRDPIEEVEWISAYFQKNLDVTEDLRNLMTACHVMAKAALKLKDNFRAIQTQRELSNEVSRIFSYLYDTAQKEMVSRIAKRSEDKEN